MGVRVIIVVAAAPGCQGPPAAGGGPTAAWGVAAPASSAREAIGIASLAAAVGSWVLLFWGKEGGSGGAERGVGRGARAGVSTESGGRDKTAFPTGARPHRRTGNASLADMAESSLDALDLSDLGESPPGRLLLPAPLLLPRAPAEARGGGPLRLCGGGSAELPDGPAGGDGGWGEIAWSGPAGRSSMERMPPAADASAQSFQQMDGKAGSGWSNSPG